MKNRACKPGRPPSPDLPPVPGKHPEVGRDYEYKRLGTASILAGLDLHDGQVTAPVERRHRNREFVGLPQDRAAYYPPRVTIRLLLDNRAHPQRNDGLPGHAPEPVGVCAYAQARLLAQLGGATLWQDGTDLFARQEGGELSGTQDAHPARHRREPGVSRRASLEQFHCT